MNLEETIQSQSNEIQALKVALDTAQKRCDQYAQAYDQMYHQLQEFFRNRFGAKSERFIDPEHPQFSLLDDNAKLFFEANQAGEAIPDSEAQVSAHSRKNRKKSEQEIKAFVIARKNFLFCAFMEGADALCLHFSLIRTAKLHGLDPYRY